MGIFILDIVDNFFFVIKFKGSSHRLYHLLLILAYFFILEHISDSCHIYLSTAKQLLLNTYTTGEKVKQ